MEHTLEWIEISEEKLNFETSLNPVSFYESILDYASIVHTFSWNDIEKEIFEALQKLGNLDHYNFCGIIRKIE